jgi:WD40 repeat protein
MVTGVYGQQEYIRKILWAANWSHDGKYIAVGGVDKQIRIFDGRTFDLIKIFQNSSEIQRLSWNPKSNLLAVAATSDGSKLIDVDRDSMIFLKGTNEGGTRAMAWNASGDLLANADYEGVITLWTSNGDWVRSIRKVGSFSYVAIDWHPFKNEFIALSDSARIYDDSGNLLNTFKHRAEVLLMLCVKWHPSGLFFALGDYGDSDEGFKPLLQFRKADGQLMKQMNISKAEYRNVSWTADGTKLATASDALRIWSAEGELLAEGLSDDHLWGVDWSPDGQWIVTSSLHGYITIWDQQARRIKNLHDK